MLLFRCSVLYEPPLARQCVSDSDCEEHAQLQGLSCDTAHGVCVSKQASLPLPCDSTAACTQQNSNLPSLCRYPGSNCLNLATPECPLVSGDWEAGDALILGSIGPHTFKQAGADSLQLEYVERLVQAIDLGLEEWQREVPSLFFSQRKFAIVHCNSDGDPAVVERAWAHLVKDIHAPVVMALTDVEQEALAGKSIDEGITLVCVECYAPARLPPQLEAGMVWRMSPPLADQAPLAAWRVGDLEQRLRVERGLADSTPIRVAAWSDDGASFDAFIERLRGSLRFNGQDVVQNGANYLELRNPDSRYASHDQLAAARRLVDFSPDILVVAINEDFTSYYLRMIESQWPNARPKPQYIVTMLNQELALLEPIVAEDDDLRQRLSGTGLFLDEQVARNLSGFRTRYRARYGRDPGRTQTGYDAWYASALAIYSADAAGSLDGTHIAAHFARLRSGPTADVDPRGLATAIAYLSAQESVDMVGASSPLDWDPFTHRVQADLGLWCLNRDTNGSLELDDVSGLRSTPAGTTGTYECPPRDEPR